MTIYETVKAAVTVKQAATHYGLRVSRNNMTCCPFHDDNRPSLKLNDTYYFCFGCGANGDIIDFTAKLLNLSNYEVAQKLAVDFSISTEPRQTAMFIQKSNPRNIRQFRDDEMFCFRALIDYLHLLEDWKIRYAPKSPEDELDDRFVEVCQKFSRIEYFADILTVGDPEERTFVVSELIRNGNIRNKKEDEHPE